MTDLDKNRIKDILYEWGGYKYLIAAEKNELEDMKLMYRNMIDIKGVCIDVPSRADKLSPSVKRAFVRNIKLCEGRLEKLNKMIKRNFENKMLIDDIVDSFTYVEQYILRARYVKKFDWEIIPLNVPFEISKRNCQRIHNTAVEKICSELKKRGKF